MNYKPSKARMFNIFAFRVFTAGVIPSLLFKSYNLLSAFELLLFELL